MTSGRGRGRYGPCAQANHVNIVAERTADLADDPEDPSISLLSAQGSPGALGQRCEWGAQSRARLSLSAQRSQT